MILISLTVTNCILTAVVSIFTLMNFLFVMRIFSLMSNYSSLFFIFDPSFRHLSTAVRFIVPCPTRKVLRLFERALPFSQVTKTTRHNYMCLRADVFHVFVTYFIRLSAHSWRSNSPVARVANSWSLDGGFNSQTGIACVY